MNFTFTRHKFLLVTVKEWLKSVLNYRSYPKNKSGYPFLDYPVGLYLQHGGVYCRRRNAATVIPCTGLIMKSIMWFIDLKGAFLILVTGCRQIVLNSKQTSLSSSGLVPDTTSVCWEALVHRFSLALVRLSRVIMFDYLV